MNTLTDVRDLKKQVHAQNLNKRLASNPVVTDDSLDCMRRVSESGTGYLQWFY